MIFKHKYSNRKKENGSMDFLSVLCILFNHLNDEKTPAAGYHILRGKRSGQMMQDVVYYDVHPFFSLLPKLSKDFFDEAIQALERENYVVVHEDAILHVTNEGKKVAQLVRPLHFDGWNYRGREEVFFARLSLVVQTLSHFKEGVHRFMPIQREREIQQFVKQFLRHYSIQDPAFALAIKNEIMEALLESQMTEEQKIVFTHRLVGYQQTGWTWDQLGEQLLQAPFTIKLHYIESLHMFLNVVTASNQYPLLKKIANEIKVENHLNDSTQRTKVLFEQGHSLETIAQIRRLKESTIEDHFVEIALNDENFPLQQFIREEDCLAVHIKANELATKRLRILKESFPHLSYFQLRLILSAPMKGLTIE